MKLVTKLKKWLKSWTINWTILDGIMYAVIEYPDGRVEEVSPPKIKFVDQVKAQE